MLRFVIFLLLFSAPTVLFAQEHSQPRQETGDPETLSKLIDLPPPVGLYKELQNVTESIRRSAPFARGLYEMTRRAGLDGTFDVEARVRAYEQSQRDLQESSVAEKASGIGAPMKPLADAWRNIGLIGSSANGVFSAGCVTAIAINPSNPNIMYAGATSGGVWKSTDAGGHWVPLTDNAIPSLAIASIAIDPKNPNTLYVGTGNGYAAIDELTGTGLYKSTDGGGTWTHIGATTLNATVVKVLVDPVRSNVIFAAEYSGFRGLYRSSDSGVTWSKVFPTSGNSAGVVWDVLATVVGGTPYLYFAEGNNVGGNSTECGIYKSIDDGVTWAKYPSQFPRGDTVGRCVLAASKGDPRRIFVFMANPAGDTISGGRRSLFRSVDNGLTWSPIAIPTTVFHGAGNQAPQGWYDCMMGVTPYSNGTTGSDTIFIGGVEGWVNFNDGAGWQDYSDNNWNWAYSHVDHHTIAFNPLDPTIVYDGCDGGLYWSTTAGYPGSWEYRSNQMVTGRFYHIGLDILTANAVTTLGGAQDQGTWKIQGTQTPTLLVGGDGLQPIVNSISLSYPYYAELPNGDLYRSNSSGNNFTQIGTSYFNDNADWNTPFKQSIAAFGSTPAYHVFYAGRQHLWRSTDDGTTWGMTSTTSFSNNIHAIGLSATPAGNMYVGSFGQIEFSTDAGTSWVSRSSNIPSSWVSSIVTTGHDPNFVLASFYTGAANHVMSSTDNGAHWIARNGSTGHTLPAVGINCVALDSVDPVRIWYAGTDNGIYYTIDSGNTWSVAGSGLGLVPCYDVEVQANKTTIRVATFGRGIWEGSTNSLPIELGSLSYLKTQSGTVLKWFTDSERGDAGFYVQRSFNGAPFEDISYVASKAISGNSNSRIDYVAPTDTMKQPGTYLYQLKQLDLDGSLHFSNHIEVHWGGNQMIVYQNYPNPLLIGTPSGQIASSFQPFGQDNTPVVQPALATRIDYELPYDETTEGDQISVKVYNSLGKFVSYAVDPNGVQVNNLAQQAGTNSAFWDGHASDGAIAPSGAYFYTIETQHHGTFVGKMVLYSN
ncbi:MAG: hypothetical protein Q8922_02010 [Bacteroidota bacterium]|nr:hypothetical protein [Bacteroidota bacterium]MDP4231998.1 hypothetical protein [Bacteroidota bacterium]MDP4241295.1 hypothetical protein [Bacteroidota bacterium]MDP4286687.1 hypothetical protein [Bacteroidota bacterium]